MRDINTTLRIVVYCFILMLTAVGCSNEPLIPSPTPGGGNVELPNGRVAFAIHSSSPIFQRPLTRTGSAEENRIDGDMWLFVFDASTTDTLFVEAVKATNHESTSTLGQSRRTADLQVRNNKVTILVLNNAPEKIYNGSTEVSITGADSWGLTASTKISDARVLLNTVRLASPQETVPYAPSLTMPMSAEINRDKLDSSTELGSEAAPISLLRVVAKVSVKKDFISTGTAIAPNFTLKGATVYNTPKSASLFPVHKKNDNIADRTNYIGVGANNEIIGIAAAVNDSTVVNPLYIYPSAEDDVANQPFIIIQAQYADDVIDSYYKLAISPLGKPIGQVERNTNYSLLIKECTGRGYKTIDEAAVAPPSNLIYTVEVTDLSSHDIIDNGQYFIGVSNSEYIIYGSESLNNLVAFTLTHNAPNTVTTRSITATTGITVTSSFPAANSTTDIVINLDPTFSTGSITISLGNLTKKIEVSRHTEIVPFANVVTDFSKILNGNDIVYGSLTNPTENWIGLSTNNSKDAPIFSQLEVPNGGMYVIFKSNVKDVGSLPRKSSIYFARRSAKGRMKVDFFQSKLNTKEIEDNEDATLPFTPIVGAFWRKEQVAERLIRIARPDGGEMDGYWYASVIQYDKSWKAEQGDGILMDLKMTKDINVGWLAGSNEALVIDGYDLETKGDDYRVVSAQDIEGYLDSSTDAGGIYFRIGLQKPYTPTINNPARYAVVLLLYTFTKNGVSKFRQQRIFIRQGEDADYIYQPTETYHSTTGYLPNGSIGEITGTRSLATKWSPYNLTDPNSNTNYDVSNRSNGNGQLPTNGATFTRYPSQGGYYFSFVERYAYCPTVYSTESFSEPPLLNWAGATNFRPQLDNIMPGGAVRVSTENNLSAVDNHELCPVGYRTPRDYSIGWRMPNGVSSNVTALVLNSEVRQSLFLNPVNGDRPNPNENDPNKANNPPENQANLSNGETATIVGVYADGFMDRRKLQTPYSPNFQAGMRKNSAAALGTVNAAYAGRLLFNPSTLASIFFPYTGSLAPGEQWGGRPYFGGDHVVYGTSTTHYDLSINNDHNGYQLIYIGYAIRNPLTNITDYAPNLVTVNPYYTGYASVIRCVKH